MRKHSGVTNHRLARMNHQQVIAMLDEHQRYLNAIAHPKRHLHYVVDIVSIAALAAASSLTLLKPVYRVFSQRMITDYLFTSEQFKNAFADWLKRQLGLKAFEDRLIDAPSLMVVKNCMKWARHHNVAPWDSEALFTEVLSGVRYSLPISECYEFVARDASAVVEPSGVYGVDTIMGYGAANIAETWRSMQSQLSGLFKLIPIASDGRPTFYNYFDALMANMRKYEALLKKPNGKINLLRVSLIESFKPLLEAMWSRRFTIAVLIVGAVLFHRLLLKLAAMQQRAQQQALPLVASMRESEQKRGAISQAAADCDNILLQRLGVVIAALVPILKVVLRQERYRITEGITGLMITSLLTLLCITVGALVSGVVSTASKRSPRPSPLQAKLESLLQRYGFTLELSSRAPADALVFSIRGIRARDLSDALMGPCALDAVHIDGASGQVTLLPEFEQGEQLVANLRENLERLASRRSMFDALKRIKSGLPFVKKVVCNGYRIGDANLHCFTLECHKVSEEFVQRLQQCFPSAEISCKAGVDERINVRGRSDVDETALRGMLAHYVQLEKQRMPKIGAQTPTQYYSGVTHNEVSLTQRRRMRAQAACVRRADYQAPQAVGLTAEKPYPDSFQWSYAGEAPRLARRIPGASGMGGVPQYMCYRLDATGAVGSRNKRTRAAKQWFKSYAMNPGPIGKTLRSVYAGNLDMQGHAGKGDSSGARANFELRPGKRSGFGKYRAFTVSRGANLPKSVDKGERRVVVESIEGWVRNTSAFHS